MTTREKSTDCRPQDARARLEQALETVAPVFTGFELCTFEDLRVMVDAARAYLDATAWQQLGKYAQDDKSPSHAYCEAAKAAVRFIAAKEGVEPDVRVYEVFDPGLPTPGRRAPQEAEQMTKAQKRGRERAEEASRQRAMDLLRWLRDHGLLAQGTSGAWDPIANWMKAEFYRGIDYGKRLAK